MAYNERFSPLICAANSTTEISGSGVGNFICTAGGNITLVANQADGKPETTILSSFAVTTGQVLELKLFLGKNGGYITTDATAAGVLGTS
jgi:hypothetical protein